MILQKGMVGYTNQYRDPTMSCLSHTASSRSHALRSSGYRYSVFIMWPWKITTEIMRIHLFGPAGSHMQSVSGYGDPGRWWHWWWVFYMGLSRCMYIYIYTIDILCIYIYKYINMYIYICMCKYIYIYTYYAGRYHGWWMTPVVCGKLSWRP